MELQRRRTYFEELKSPLSRDGGKIPQKIVERVAFFDIVEQGLDGNPRAGETRRPMHNFRGNRNHSGKAGFLFGSHNPEDRPDRAVTQVGAPRAIKQAADFSGGLVLSRNEEVFTDG